MRMPQTIKPSTNKIVEEFLDRHNVFMSRVTARQKLLHFFESVKPINTSFPLIRIGGEKDGGYLIPDDLLGVRSCFSPGVSTVADFENDLSQRGIRCFLADYSVDFPPINNPLFDFEKKFLGAVNNDRFMTLQHWVYEKAMLEHEMILQMDIEGGEYPVILESPIEILKQFRILVIEFHNLDHLLNPMGFQLIQWTFAKLLKDFAVVHIHPNNWRKPVEYRDISIPAVMEFTFLRKDRIKKISKTTCFPHPLDRANIPDKPDYPLPTCWYLDNTI